MLDPDLHGLTEVDADEDARHSVLRLRLRNVQQHPAWYTLLDQMSVR